MILKCEKCGKESDNGIGFAVLENGQEITICRDCVDSEDFQKWVDEIKENLLEV